MFLLFVLYHLMLSVHVMGRKFGMGFLGGGGGLNFGPGIFMGLDFCPHSIIPITLNPE